MTIEAFLLSVEFIRLFSLLCLQFFVLLTLWQLLFSPLSDKKSLQKIVGGMLVFIIAIVSHNGFIYFMSLFIGGLIIASEEFMKFIFAVWKSDPRSLDKTIQSFQSVSVPTPEEIKEKTAEEVESIVQDKRTTDSGKTRLRQKYLKIETLVHDYFRQNYGKKYVEQVKIENPQGSMVFDGAVLADRDFAEIFTQEELKNRNDVGIQFAVEIKYFRKPTEVFPLIRRLLERINFFTFILLHQIAIVVEDINEAEAQKLYFELVQQYRGHSQFQFLIFSHHKGEIRLLQGEE